MSAAGTAMKAAVAGACTDWSQWQTAQCCESDGALSREAPMRCALSSCASSTDLAGIVPALVQERVIDTGTLPVITSSANSARLRLCRRARSTNQQRNQNWRKAGRLEGWRLSGVEAGRSKVKACRALRPSSLPLRYTDGTPVEVHLIDGTYELFRHFYALPSRERRGRPRGRRGARRRQLGARDDHAGATHVGVATDHVIESFRNRLWRGYKTGAGIDPALFAQFTLLEEALAALGITVWPMVEFEADDALAAAAEAAARDPRVERVIICTPDKDLAQCVRGTPRRADGPPRADRSATKPASSRGSACLPASIPDYLALVGDTADGYPGLPGWGAKSAAAVLARYHHLEAIPEDCRTWGVNAASPARLARVLAAIARATCSCSARWRRCAPTSTFSSRSTTCDGRDRRRRSRRWRRASIARQRQQPRRARRAASLRSRVTRVEAAAA